MSVRYAQGKHRIHPSNGMERTLRYDHYKVLGVPRDATSKEIKRAYRERVKQWHPDRNESEQASEVFHALHEAYLTLKDEGSRTAYDERLRFYRAAHDAPEPIPNQRPHAHRIHEDRTPPSGWQRTAYKGLHLTGLLFGGLMVLGICAGCLLRDWPAYMLVFALPGLAVLPDSLAGLRDH